MVKEEKHKSKFWSRTKKVMLILVVVLVLLVSGALVYLNIKKNDIGQKLISQVNTLLVGEINVGKIEIESLWTFPDINIHLKDIVVYESDVAVRDSGATPVIVAPNLKARVNFKEILSSELEIKFVEISDAVVVIERTEDSRVTIRNTFLLTEKDSSILFVLNIDSIHLINTQVRLKHASLKDSLLIRVKELTGHLTYAKSKVDGFADAYGHFEKFDISKRLTFTNSPLSFKVDYKVAIKDKKVFASSPRIALENIPLQFDLIFDYGSKSSIKLDFESLKEGLEIGSSFGRNDTVAEQAAVRLKGRTHLSSSINWKSNPKKSFLNNVTANIDMHGKNIAIAGIDLDTYIAKYKRSQNFNLLDVGAVMFAGPAGLAVTKASDYTSFLIKPKKGNSTVVNQFVSEWKFENGKLEINDLAMSTQRSRIASLGFYDINKDSIDFRILILDKFGCAMADQRVYGYTNDVQSGRVKIVKTLLGPVKNLFRSVGLAKCKVFYEGKVSHPEKKKKK